MKNKSFSIYLIYCTKRVKTIIYKDSPGDTYFYQTVDILRIVLQTQCLSQSSVVFFLFFAGCFRNVMLSIRARNLTPQSSCPTCKSDK